MMIALIASAARFVDGDIGGNAVAITQFARQR